MITLEITEQDTLNAELSGVKNRENGKPLTIRKEKE